MTDSDLPTKHSVWKFPLDPSGWVVMPKGAKPLHVAVQDGAAFVWAEVWPTNRMVRRHLPVYGTGHTIDGWPDYLGTFHLDGLVFHVFTTFTEASLSGPSETGTETDDPSGPLGPDSAAPS